MQKQIEKKDCRRGETNLAGFILCDFVLGVFFAVFALAVGTAGFGNVDLSGSASQLNVIKIT